MEIRDKAAIIRNFLVKTECRQCSSYCYLHYYPVKELCPKLEDRIKEALKEEKDGG